VADRQTFRSPFAVVVWWAWVLFALGNLIDLAVQGRDHFSVVAAFILVLVTGVVFATAQRPRIIADDEGLSIVNPLRRHRVGWAAVTAVEATDLLRVRCEWPLDSGEDTDGKGRKVIYSWAVYSSRRRQVTSRARADRARTRPPRGSDAARPFGAPAQNGQSTVMGDVGPVVAALGARAETAHAAAPGQRARPPVSTWSWQALAAIVIPALALVVAILA
jgi:Bacterial PH domain